jgi:GNAT superfamily N-acetyltransferase
MSPFRSLAHDESIDRWISKTLPWIHERRGIRTTTGSLEAPPKPSRRSPGGCGVLPRRCSSDGVTLLVDHGRTVGGFIALPGSELADCRRADAVATVQAVKPEQRGSVLARMRSARGLFRASAEEFYLSKMGVAPSHRGIGHGATMVRRFLEVGGALGFSPFPAGRLGRKPACHRLYEAAGFRVLRKSSVDQGRMTYLAMVLQHDPT